MRTPIWRLAKGGVFSQLTFHSKLAIMATTAQAKTPPARSVSAKAGAKPKKDKKAYSKETYMFWFESMLLMRKFEEKAGQLYGMQKIRGFCHLYIGQEACAAGAVSALIKGDKYITAYRDHAHPLALGTSPNAVMAELYGKETGVSKGKGGSMHIFDKEHGFYGGHGIVGAQIPLGAGIAFAEMYNETGNLCICYMGDGAVRQGAFHEALNLAMLWKIPVIFAIENNGYAMGTSVERSSGIAFAEMYNETGNLCICYMGDGAVRQGAFHEALNLAMLWKIPVIFAIENNGYAMGTSVERSSNVVELYTLGESYDMPSEPVDAMNVEDVHDAVERAAERARAGEGPTLLEFRTYRYKGHSMSDPQKYRSKQEVEEYKQRDPIEQVRDTILKKKIATEKDLEAIEKKVLAQVDESVKFAEESSYPDPSEAMKDIYAEPDYPFIAD